MHSLAVVAVLAAGTYVAYRLGLGAAGRGQRRRDAAGTRQAGARRWTDEPIASGASSLAPVGRPGRTATEAEEAPTGGVATVAATMDASAPATQYEGNGSPRVVQLAPEPAAAAPSATAPVLLSGRRGLSGTTLAAIATAVGIAAIGLGAAAVALSINDEDGNGATAAVELQGVQQVVSLLSKPSTERIPLQGSSGRIILVVGARGYGVLVLDGLSPAPAGKSYQAWVIRPNADSPQSAAVFSAQDVVVSLTTRVPPGAAVAITLERAGGAPIPTQTPKLVATRGT
jgi:Anti-sigma-K factor rskA